MKYFLSVLAALLLAGWTVGAFAGPNHDVKEKGKLEMASAKQVEANEEGEAEASDESEESEEGIAAGSAKITLQEAIQTALTRVPGSVDEAQLESEEGTLLYEVSIIGEDRSRTEVQVDAQSGQIVKVGKGESGAEHEEENEG